MFLTKKNKDNIVGYNTKNKNTFNVLGNYYIGGEGKHISFVRNPDELYKQYHNLIYKLGKSYGKRETTVAGRQDLYEYIADAFVSLVLEYDMENDVDFPGYITKMLRYRIEHSYYDKKYKYDNHISPLESAEDSIDKVQEDHQGSANFSYSMSIKSDINKKKQKDGILRGEVIQIVNSGNNNEDDYSLFYLHDLLRESDIDSKSKHLLIDLIGKDNLSPSESRKEVADELSLSADEVNQEYNELKQFLINF